MYYLQFTVEKLRLEKFIDPPKFTLSVNGILEIKD